MGNFIEAAKYLATESPFVTGMVVAFVVICIITDRHDRRNKA